MNLYIVQIFSFGIATFLLWMLIIPYFINFLRENWFGKQIREQATYWMATLFSKLHAAKKWTPTMWGLVILFITFLMIVLSIFLQEFWIIRNSLFNQAETYLSLFTLLSVGALGFFDDYLNIKWVWKTKWVSALFKLIWLILFSIAGALWFYYKLDWWDMPLNLTVIKWVTLWAWIMPVFVFIILATANSVNITDWLDWLAGWLLLFAYAVYAYITFDQWMFLLSALCITITWALVAFLWFNVKPAKIYMWDVWSLALWANLWIMAMLTNTIFILAIVSAVFIAETLSVIIQLLSKRFRNWKKVFLIAPFHHHLEAKWRPEENVVFRLWLIWIIFSIFGVMFYILQK